MTSKKRRGRRPQSLPQVPAATVGHVEVRERTPPVDDATADRESVPCHPTEPPSLAPTAVPTPVAGGVAGLKGGSSVAQERHPGVFVSEAESRSVSMDGALPVLSGKRDSAGAATGSLEPGEGHPGSASARLRAAREARGLSREALAATARIPLSAIGHIEAGNIAALGAPIYARGFLRSYARAVGVPEVVVDTFLRDVQADEPALVIATPASVSDRLAARYKNPLVYALLTLVVVVPLVFLATPQGQRQPEQVFAPLDAEMPASSPSVARGAERVDVEADRSTPAVLPPPPPAPVMASMAPITTARPVGGRMLVLRVSEPSWIELTTADGRRLEWAQLPAGTTREYVVDGGADLVVGNVPGVSATLNGRPLDLNAVANRNVARLRVGDATPATGQ